MHIRYGQSPQETKLMDTAQLRSQFLIENLFDPNVFHFTYTMYDRAIVGGAMPIEPMILGNYDALKSQFFLERREMGVINIGGAGEIEADGQTYAVNKLDCVYLGKNTEGVVFRSKNAAEPAQFFIMSTPAHQVFPSQLMTKEAASPVDLGSVETANERTIYKYIHPDGIKSCQLVMGLTVLKKGSVWNTMPAHTHDRRMEIYCYFDLPEAHRVFHYMGHPQETRHLLVANHEAIISPPWSIHAGAGTTNYSFIWAMAGENQAFTDMDFVEIKDLR